MNSKVIAGIITSIVIFLLVLSGPAQALKLNLTGFSVSEIVKGEKISTTASIQIQSNERVNLDEIVLYLDNSPFCYFNPYTGNPITGCGGITIEVNSNSLGYGYGYGYAYGYGYGYGYNNGYSNGILTYTLNLDTNYFSTGEHKLILKTELNNHVYESDERTIKIKEKENQIYGSGGGSGGVFSSNKKVNPSESQSFENPINEIPEETIVNENPGFVAGITGAVIGTLGKTGSILVGVFVIGIAGASVTLMIRRTKLAKKKK